MVCPYYADCRREMANGAAPLRAPDAVAADDMLPYCQHKHSPVTRNVVLNMTGGAKLLRCGGDIGKCQVPAKKRLDLS